MGGTSCSTGPAPARTNSNYGCIREQAEVLFRFFSRHSAFLRDDYPPTDGGLLIPPTRRTEPMGGKYGCEAWRRTPASGWSATAAFRRGDATARKFSILNRG